MQTVEISVVVPVYNAARYVRETLDCLAGQSFRDFEVIVVDDGSTDEGPGIIDAYCAEHAGFFAIHTPNGGEHKARLAGIERARGRYLAFCDSDDLPLPDMLEKLYAQAERSGADITVCGFTREEMDSGRVLSREMCSFGNRCYEYPELCELLPVINPAVWNKLFRAELLRHLIEIEHPTRVAMDLVFTCSLYPFVRRIAFVPEALYRYRVRPGSAVSHVDADEIERIRENVLLTCAYILRHKDSRELRLALDSLVFTHIGWSMVIRQVTGGEASGAAVRSARQWLEQYFPGYRRAGRSLLWNLRHRMRLIRILIGRWIFCLHLMGPFLLLYGFITQKLKKEIKW